MKNSKDIDAFRESASDENRGTRKHGDESAGGDGNPPLMKLHCQIGTLLKFSHRLLYSSADISRFNQSATSVTHIFIIYSTDNEALSVRDHYNAFHHSLFFIDANIPILNIEVATVIAQTRRFSNNNKELILLLQRRITMRSVYRTCSLIATSRRAHSVSRGPAI